MASTAAADDDESKCGRGRIQGKVAIVTGGAQGIGAAIVRRFVEEGALVAIFDVAEHHGTALSKELGTCAQFFKVDMSSEDAVKASVAAVTAWSGGRLDILVNNAAAFVFGEVEDVTSDQWDKVRTSCLPRKSCTQARSVTLCRMDPQILGVNVKGYAYAMKHAFPVFKATGGGAVVNLASISSFIAQPAFVPYSTTKGAILVCPSTHMCVPMCFVGGCRFTRVGCPPPANDSLHRYGWGKAWYSCQCVRWQALVQVLVGQTHSSDTCVV